MFNEANSRLLHGLSQIQAFVLQVVVMFVASIVPGIVNKISIKVCKFLFILNLRADNLCLLF